MTAIPPTSPNTPLATPGHDGDLPSSPVVDAIKSWLTDRSEAGDTCSADYRGVDAGRSGAVAGGGQPLYQLAAFLPVAAAPGVVVKASAQQPSPVDSFVADVTSTNLDPDVAAAKWNALTATEQRAVVGRLLEKDPAAAAELANQLGQATDKTAADSFWKQTETWMTTAVADSGYHSARLPQARAFMDEVAILSGEDGKATKGRASRMASNIQFSDEFGELNRRAHGSGIAEADRKLAQLHLDTWRNDMRSGVDPSIQALARRDPAGFVHYINGLKSQSKYDAAVNAALSQPDVDFTGRGVRGSHTTDPYMENLYAAVGKYGTAETKASFALRSHKGGSLRPGYDDAKAARRELMTDPKVLSILLHDKAEQFSLEMRDMIKTDPARAQRIIGAGVAGYTLAYHEAMSKNPPDLAAAEKSAYDLGLLLGETKESAREAFVANPAEGYNFLEGVFGVVSKQVLGLIPGENIAAEVGKEILGEIAGHFTTELTKFKEDTTPEKIDKAIDTFVASMFSATRESFWTLRDPKGLHDTVRNSKELDGIKAEHEQFDKWLEAGYAAGRDEASNGGRTDGAR